MERFVPVCKNCPSGQSSSLRRIVTLKPVLAVGRDEAVVCPRVPFSPLRD